MSFEVATWDVIYDEITQNNQLSGIVVFDAERVEIQDTHVDVWTVEDGKDVHYILPWDMVIFIKEVNDGEKDMYAVKTRENMDR